MISRANPLQPQDQTPVPVADPVDFLTGKWTYHRRVSDQLGDRSGHAAGVAIFEPAGDGLLWRESGRLAIDDHSFDASRETSIEPGGDQWRVLFDDGRFFHRLDLSRGTCEVGHPCREDQYDGGYRVTGPTECPEFTTEWRVTGPAKDQLIFTRYRRINDGR